MYKILTSIVISLLFSSNLFAKNLVAGGATFPAPIYNKWTKQYYKESGNRVNYAAIGSAAGIKQLESETFDFAGTDVALSSSELKNKKYHQFPFVVSGVVPVVNLLGIEDLVLDGKTLAGIFEGTITKWNHPDIVSLNPGKVLPDMNIIKIVRADGSGTSEIFSHYLAKHSTTFKKNVGVSKFPKWGGTSTGGKGNAGVASFMQKIRGTIGYVEYSYLTQGGLSPVRISQPNGKVIDAGFLSFVDAVNSADWNVPGLAVDLTNQANGWPITAATFIVLRESKMPEVFPFIEWVFKHGDTAANDLGYIPLTQKVKSLILSKLKSSS